MKIVNVHARQILDSRGNPTIEVDVFLKKGLKASASVPSGASTGEREAVELRDGEKDFFGKSVFKAVENVNEIIYPAIKGQSVFNQEKIDQIMIDLDGTENKSKLGANAILGVSMAVARAGAMAKGVELFKYLSRKGCLPQTMMNVINGGKHADNNLNCQEYMISAISGKNYLENLKINVEVFHTLKGLLKSKGLSTSVGDEGGFAPKLENDEHALKIIVEAIKKAGYTPFKDVVIALDMASSEMWKEGVKKGLKNKYYFWKSGETFTTKQLISYYQKLTKTYPIVLIEDGMAENDWEGWRLLTEKLGDKIELVGDDLFVTNAKFLKQGIEQGVANSILIKPNQIGTVTQTLKTINLAKKHGYKIMISHRSGETTDTFIADLAVAVSAQKIKAGAPSRGERVAKYNRLLQINEVID